MDFSISAKFAFSVLVLVGLVTKVASITSLNQFKSPGIQAGSRNLLQYPPPLAPGVPAFMDGYPQATHLGQGVVKLKVKMNEAGTIPWMITFASYRDITLGDVSYPPIVDGTQEYSSFTITDSSIEYSTDVSLQTGQEYRVSFVCKDKSGNAGYVTNVFFTTAAAPSPTPPPPSPTASPTSPTPSSGNTFHSGFPNITAVNSTTATLEVRTQDVGSVHWVLTDTSVRTLETQDVLARESLPDAIDFGTVETPDVTVVYSDHLNLTNSSTGLFRVSMVAMDASQQPGAFVYLEFDSILTTTSDGGLQRLRVGHGLHVLVAIFVSLWFARLVY